MRTLAEWLDYQQHQHHSRVELGLERVRRVWRQLRAPRFDCPVIVVGGTNGKGSAVRYLRQIYHQAGYRVAAYTSPHLGRYNERIDIHGAPVSDAALAQAFEHVESARQSARATLTYFEYGTLAALWLFARARADAVLLEVGMGGRLDAVNILPHDLAIITNVSLDHERWLGRDIESIASEKAGIARAGKPLIYADEPVPNAVRDYCDNLRARLLAINRDFHITHRHRGRGGWSWRDSETAIDNIAAPGIAGAHQIHNAAAALCAVRLLRGRLPVSVAVLRTAIGRARLPGRLQTVARAPRVIVDVAHNAAAVGEMADHIGGAAARNGRKIAVFAMQDSRAPRPLLEKAMDVVDVWHLCGLSAAPCHPPAALHAAVKELNPQRQARQHATVAAAMRAARNDADGHDTIIVFGSFHTVAEGMACLGV